MYEAIKNFPKQFLFKPVIQNKATLGKKYERFVVLGMGGSNLATELLKIRDPRMDISAHRTYDLPRFSSSLSKRTLFIASSYSGNTEETLESFRRAVREKVPLAVITTGGKLLELAKRHRVPYVELPQTGIQPRAALGYSILALAAFIRPVFLRELRVLSSSLPGLPLEKKGKALAQKIRTRVPIMYAAIDNFPLAYNWKIKFNETGKVPAFANSFPELNHNEMTGFDVARLTKKLSAPFHFIFLKGKDDPRILKRMETTAALYRERGLPVEVIELTGKTPFQRIFNALLLADWTAYYTAQNYQVEAEQVPMVERFKRLISGRRRK